MKPSVVITGAAGFVGSHISRRLVREGFRVHAIVRSAGDAWRIADIASHMRLYPGLLDHPRELRVMISRVRPQAVYHLAAYGSYQFQKRVDRMVHVNIMGTHNLFTSLLGMPVGLIVLAGSSSEYGRKNLPMREDDVLEPTDLYAVTKAAQTHIAGVFSRQYGLPVVTFRLFSVYGPGEEHGRLVRTTIESVLSGQPVRLASGQEARDFVYVEDVADAFFSVTRKQPAKIVGGIFNIGTGAQTTTSELASEVMRYAHKTVPVMLQAYAGRWWDSPHWQADVKKTRRVLGWKANTTLSAGLKKTIAWYKDHPVQEDTQ